MIPVPQALSPSIGKIPPHCIGEHHHCTTPAARLLRDVMKEKKRLTAMTYSSITMQPQSAAKVRSFTGRTKNGCNSCRKLKEMLSMSDWLRRLMESIEVFHPPTHKDKLLNNLEHSRPADLFEIAEISHY